MSELGNHVSSLHSEHMFEPIAILRTFVKLLRTYNLDFFLINEILLRQLHIILESRVKTQNS